MPSGCCPSPVTAEGTLFFAGGGPSGPEDKEMQMPSFDAMLKDLDKDGDGALSREEAEKAFQGFFDNQDLNHDGKITRPETWRDWRCDNISRALEKDQGLAVPCVCARVSRAVRHGEGRRNRHCLRREDGPGSVPGTSGSGWQVLRLTGCRQWENLFHIFGRRHNRAEGGNRKTRSAGDQPEARRAHRGDSSYRGQYVVCQDRKAPVRLRREVSPKKVW